MQRSLPPRCKERCTFWGAPQLCKTVGSGESPANYKRVIEAVHRICDPAPDGLGISQRSVPLNPTPGSKWDASPKPVEREFVRRVVAQGVTCTVRDTRGQEIAAACGQLAAEG